MRWVDAKLVACDGGGGPLGHPKIFINVDKPQINMCTYCGLPYVREEALKLELQQLTILTGSRTPQKVSRIIAKGAIKLSVDTHW